MASTNIQVRMSRTLQKQFKDAAKIAYPCEEYAICLGTRQKNNPFKLTVKFLFFPENRARFCSPDHVLPQDVWYEEAKLIAAAQGLVVLGDIHSHCFAGDDFVLVGRTTVETITGPSFQDLKGCWSLAYFTDGFVPVFGICAVKKCAKRVVTMINFWPAVPVCELVTTDG